MWSKSAFYDFYVFFKDIKSQFSKANLGYLDNFLGGMLESKLALNNLNLKCYIQFFGQTTHWAEKYWGHFLPPPLL